MDAKLSDEAQQGLRTANQYVVDSLFEPSSPSTVHRLISQAEMSEAVHHQFVRKSICTFGVCIKIFVFYRERH